MSGDGPSGRLQRNIYFATGQMAHGTDSADFGDSIVKLGPPIAGSFNAASFDYFTPINQDALNTVDEISVQAACCCCPNNASANAHLLVQAGKEGKSIC